MRIKNIFYIMMSLTLGLFAVETGDAATIIASSCLQPDVQSAINRAVSGDKVNIPPGSCAWTSAVRIPDGKKITLQGAGKASTIITSNISSEGYSIFANYSGSRITGIGFEFINVAGGISVRGTGWRVDNCLFNNSTGATRAGVHPNGGTISNQLYGLVDHCEFINSRVLVYGDLNLLAHGIWARSLGLGTDSAVYVEDCTFRHTQFGNCIDADYGGAYVFRYNTVTDTYVEAHSVQGNNRAARKWEIYNNTFNQVNQIMWAPMMLRAGTGVVFNNNLTGTWDQPGISLDNVRSCESRTTSGMCNGSSPWDGNQINGYPCRDQIGRSTDQYLWTAGTPYPPQILDPAYAWNNRFGGNDVNFFQHGCALSQAHIQPNRDYYNNIEKQSYTPYTYPHPLITTWGAGIVAPRNFRLSAN